MAQECSKLQICTSAAHNLYPKYFKKEPDSLLFIPALNGAKSPYGIIGVKRYFYPEELRIPD